jgi:pimeloyl-ACP methyl ester carboxylesterase
MALDLAPAAALVARYPLAKRTVAHGAVSYREAGAGPALVLLHGIGSQSGSWVGQIEALAPRFRAIAWDAPGYGESDRLPGETPSAADYADALAALLDALRVDHSVLVASSLGALVAGAFAARWPQRVRSLVLLNPAGGYGRASPQEREEKLAARLDRLARLGPRGMAEDPSPGMLSSAASTAARALAAWSTAALRPEGYAQAARMLANGWLAEDAARYPGPVLVVGTTADTITPPRGCEAIARAFPRGRFRLLEGPGHLSYLDVPASVNALVAEFAARAQPEAAT